ncbi:MAG: glycosyltransferase family 39 protein, partial [Candidatus Aenigmarchaeota archaeon]|nr:glycosyltransferase family 39 protein [Candidatus Aenigmarchaeota archaeon]
MVYDFKKKKNIIINRIKGLFSKVNGKFKNSLKHGKKEKLDCLSEKNIIIERVKKDIAIIRKSVCKNKEFSNYEKNEKTVNGEKNEKTVKEKRKLFFLTEKIKQTKVYFFLEKYYAQIFLAALILFHTIVNWWWLSVDTLPPGWDQAGHLIESLKIYEIFTHPSIDIFSRLAEVSNYYPPFFEICTVPFYLLFGISDDVAIMTNILFLGILILSVYGIGKKMYNKKTGLFSAFLVSFYPIIFGHLREYLMDVSLTAMVTLSIYLLLKTDYFNNRMYSMLFGISLGLGMLTKWTFVFFICPAILLIIFGLIIKNTNINEVKLNFKSYFFNRIKLFFISKKTRNLLLLSLIGFLIASFWYVPNYDSVKSLLLGHSSDSGAIEGDPEIFTLKSITWYFVGLINHNIFLPFFIVFLIGLFFLIKNISNNKIRTSILLLWILIPWGVFTFIRNKDIRYIMPLLPAIAIISSFWIMNLKKKTIKSLVVLSIVIIALFQFVLITSGVSWLPHEDTISTPIGDLKIYSQHVHVTHHPKAEDWKIEEILANINELNYFRPVICIVPNNYRFMNSNFKYYLELNNYSFISKNIRTNKYEKNLYYCDFIITKSENQGPSFTTKYIEKAMIYIDSNPLIFNDTFTIFEKHSLPDSSVSKIYRRVIPRIKILENKTNLKYNYDIIFENISFKGMNISKKYLENKIYLNIIYCWKSLNKIDKDWVAFVH